MDIPDWSAEDSFVARGYRFVVGIDEAGRGPLCGSVVAAAAMRRDGSEIPEKYCRLIRDSKTLSPKQRETAFQVVQDHFFVGVGESSPETIDRMNILQATFLAMKKALGELRRVTEGSFAPGDMMMVLADGDKKIPHLSVLQEAVPKGDSRVRSIAAASIVAKVTRDRQMAVCHESYPLYGFDRHKGYGTSDHIEALRRYGPTPIHRFSFRPVREAADMSGINRELAMLRLGGRTDS